VMAARLRVAKARRGISSETCSACGGPVPVEEGSQSVRITAGRSCGRTELDNVPLVKGGK
jgi:hypothetical protein